jgi:hypothetical protein
MKKETVDLVIFDIYTRWKSCQAVVLSSSAESLRAGLEAIKEVMQTSLLLSNGNRP